MNANEPIPGLPEPYANPEATMAPAPDLSELCLLYTSPSPRD